MQDYQLEVNENDLTFTLIRYDLKESFVLKYELKNKKLHHIFGEIQSSSIDIYLQQIDKKSIPLLNSSFHWTTEHLGL